MTEYRIHDLERLSGIKAHTIRIWEKRYGLIEPLRTATNRRNYSGEQLLKLMNVATLLDRGYKISAVAAMQDADILALIEQLHKERTGTASVTTYINALTTAMVAFDELAFKETFDNAVRDHGFMEAMMQVVYPFMRKTGLLWRTEKVASIQEHFASCIIRNKLIAAIEHLPVPTHKRKPYLLFLPPDEWHELALLLTNYILRSKDKYTIYLGQSVPYEDINAIVDTVKPDCMLTFYITPRPVAEITRDLEALGKRFPGTKLYYAGDPAILKDLNIRHKNATYLDGVEDLLKIV